MTPTGEPYLTTDRLVLRRFTAGDADLLVELDADPEVTRFITGGRPTPRTGRPDDRGRARLPAAPGGVGRGLRDRGVGGAAAQGVRRAGCHPRVGRDDGADQGGLRYEITAEGWATRSRDAGT